MTLKWLFWLTFIIALMCEAYIIGYGWGRVDGMHEVYNSIGYIH